MVNKTKVLILVKSLDGGTGTYALSLSKKKGFDLPILSFEKPRFRKTKNRKIYFLRKSYRYPQRYLLGKDVFSFLEDILKFKKFVEKYRPDIVLAVESHANLVTQIGRAFFGFKYKTILTTHIDLEKTIKDKSSKFTYLVLKSAVSFFYQKADYLVGVSKGVAGGLKKDFGITKDIRVIYNGIPLKRPFVKRKPGKAKTIVTVGRLVEQKDHLTLIKAMKQVLRVLPKAHLLIPSDGPLGQRLQKYVKENKLSENIKFLGWVDNLNEVYERSDLFVLSTKREGFGYAIIEAMTFSVPIISTDVNYGPREVLDKGKYGILVPPGNIRLLAKAIISLLSDHNKYSQYSKKAYNRALMFGEQSMWDRYLRLISDLQGTR